MKTLKGGLKKLRVLGAFKRAIPAYRGKQDINEHLDMRYNALMGAFIWSKTVEGYEYWNNIYHRLNTYFDE
jgi:hypothetical protein